MYLLLQNTHPYQVERCHVSGEFIRYGDWYYLDTETNQKILYETYHTKKAQKQIETFNYDRLINAQDKESYKEELKRYEMQFLEETMLDKGED